jgi:leucyl-tRNA synthetase
MHLIYARFFTKVLFDSGLLGFSEPFKNLFTQGMICKEAYYSADRGYLTADQVRWENGRALDAHNGTPVEARLEKMSKSRLNVVPPDKLIRDYGADAVRLYTLFLGPPEKDAEWNDQAMEGASRFLRRLWKKVQETAPELSGLDRAPVDRGGMTPPEKSLSRKTHQTIAKVSRDMEGDFHFNTAIAAVMELINDVYSFEISAQEKGRESRLKVMREALEAAVLCLAPFVPHVCEELWRVLGHGGSVFRAAWPQADPRSLAVEEVEMAVQVNGKVRGRVTVPADLDEEGVRASALQDERVRSFISGEVVKVIVVPRRLINIVIRPRD